MDNLGPSNQRVLVTGGAGFIGSHLADALVSENQVRILDNLSTGDRKNIPQDAELIQGDITDPDILKKSLVNVDIVFHEAAQVSVQKSVENPTDSFENNTEPVVQLLEYAREMDFRVVFASSAAVYGNPEYTPLDEKHPKNPSSPYGLEKLTSDSYVRMYHDLYDVETVALRYFNVYGPRQTAGDYSGVISIFKEQAENGNDITVEGDGKQTRDFVHVNDVVQANLLAAETDVLGEAFNIGTGSKVTIRKLAETIHNITDSDSEINHVTPRQGDIPRSEASVQKARKHLGYNPLISLEEGLRSLVNTNQ